MGYRRYEPTCEVSLTPKHPLIFKIPTAGWELHSYSTSMTRDIHFRWFLAGFLNRNSLRQTHVSRDGLPLPLSVGSFNVMCDAGTVASNERTRNNWHLNLVGH